jgi:hypothetical protein
MKFSEDEQLLKFSGADSKSRKSEELRLEIMCFTHKESSIDFY